MAESEGYMPSQGKRIDPRKSDEENHPERYFISPVGHPRDRIILHNSPEVPKEGVFISLNGFPFMIPPDVEIDLPRPVRLMLDTRIKTETRRTDDGRGNVNIHTRNMKRFTYTIVKLDVENIPPAEVIAAGKPEMQVEAP
jgi:hypothetical protein